MCQVLGKTQNWTRLRSWESPEIVKKGGWELTGSVRAVKKPAPEQEVKIMGPATTLLEWPLTSSVPLWMPTVKWGSRSGECKVHFGAEYYTLISQHLWLCKFSEWYKFHNPKLSFTLAVPKLCILNQFWCSDFCISQHELLLLCLLIFLFLFFLSLHSSFCFLSLDPLIPLWSSPWWQKLKWMWKVNSSQSKWPSEWRDPTHCRHPGMDHSQDPGSQSYSTPPHPANTPFPISLWIRKDAKQGNTVSKNWISCLFENNFHFEGLPIIQTLLYNNKTKTMGDLSPLSGPYSTQRKNDFGPRDTRFNNIQSHGLIWPGQSRPWFLIHSTLQI